MSQFRLPRLGDRPDSGFPPTQDALPRPNGLLAWGGGLEPERLLDAYSQGIFPWYSEDEPVLWWTPDPRCVLFPDKVHLSRRTRRRYNTMCYQLTADTAFAEVIEACAQPRNGIAGTWITPELEDSFLELHKQGYAHSVEVWREDRLVGGIYGLSIGKVFFGESMFSRDTDASKIALVALCRQLEFWSYGLLDCQVTNPHLLSMGAVEIPRPEFNDRVANCTRIPSASDDWSKFPQFETHW